ncbi:MAG: phospho-N-acetylmuramoyl-pentapeptide-transferase, partial [Deltaproteobacteria bacterium]|nr:phospho-N-acetylmuramoyl-pentapeptide-transferase [Deltaproteobacteria bacterium]
MLYKILFPLGHQYIFFNIFKYITFRTFGALLTALVLYFILGKWMIRFLQNWQVTQTIRSDGPKSHLGKTGTPTMGGLLILFCTIVSVLLWMEISNLSVWLVLGLYTAYALIGFWDDYRKIHDGSSQGLSGKKKLIAQILVATIVSYLLIHYFIPDTRLAVPFFKTVQPELDGWYLPFAVLVMVGASNAV